MNIRNLALPALLLICFGLTYSCIQPFSPPEVNSDENYLVVDGFLNVGGDTSKFQLRRSQNINDYSSPAAETGQLPQMYASRHIACRMQPGQ